MTRQKLLAVVLATALLIGFSAYALAAPIILQPGPGLNDGSDYGGADAGKDAIVFQWESNGNWGDRVTLNT
ncbi:MAG: hypothetical protein SWQ30_16320 [Thermodesulfobacteriota bacterium]|nr:hypothetical protein [Thermodesulfobacteriota bacterium]